MRLRGLMAAILAGVLLPAVAGAQTNIFRTAYEQVSGLSATGIAVGDFNRDGNQDVAMCDSSSSTLAVLNGFGDGTFGSPNGPALSNVPSGMIQGKFDGDALDDLIVAEGNADSVVFLHGLGTSPDYFAPPGDLIAAGSSPVGLASANLDGDPQGHLDLVVADEGVGSGAPGAVTVLLGDGQGDFTLQVQPNPDPNTVGSMPTVDSLPTGLGGSTAVAVGNIDANPDLEVLVLNPSANSISIFKNDTGILTPDGTLPTGNMPEDLALVDLGNGHLDLVVANSNDDAITVQLGNGDGTFGEAQVYPVGNTPTRIVLGDLNNDGKLDIAVSNQRSADVSVLLGDGSGAFARARTYVATPQPQVLALADFNGDNFKDVVVAPVDGQDPVVDLVNRGDGSLHAVEDVPAGSGPQSLAVADLDGDGVPDLLASVNGTEVAVLPGGRQGFGAPIRINIGGTTLGVAAADLNGDAQPDIIAVDQQHGCVAVALSQGGGHFGAPVCYMTASASDPAASKPNAVTVGDFNGDGRPDLAVSATGHVPTCNGGANDGKNCMSDNDCPGGMCPTAPGVVAVLLQQANGSFGPAQNTDVEDEPIALTAANVNCDGRDDLIVANLASSTISVLNSKGDGTFTLAQTLSNTPQNPVVGLQPVALAVADFNEDGVQDFAVADNSAPTGSIIHLFQGSCTGPFVPFGPVAQTTNLARALVARDFTGEQPAHVDLALVNSTANAIFLFKGDGHGGMKPVGSDGVSRMPVALAAADFDLDGRYDAATANDDPSANNLSVLYNCGGDVTGNGAPVNCNPFVASGPALSLPLRGDGNGDGRRSAADLVAVSREVMDGDGVAVEAIGQKGYLASSGVDANGDGRVDAQDRQAVAHRIFGS